MRTRTHTRFPGTAFPGAPVLGAVLIAVALPLMAGCDRLQDTRQSLAFIDAAEPAVSDRDLALRVMTALANDASLKDYRITVVTREGDVRLVGVLDTQVQVRHAGEVARAVAGAQTVHDELGIWQ